jgi:hypothetical protein
MPDRPTAVRPMAWGRSCPGCKLVGIIVIASEHAPAGYATHPAPWPPRVGWWCPCGRWVELVPEGRQGVGSFE